MNKRMKDPKGDLRFVHKSTRVYDFSSLKLTAMVCRQAGKSREAIDKERLNFFASWRLCAKKEELAPPPRWTGFSALREKKIAVLS
jgi:hypothetical protein